jgi:hypothetical protein
VKVQHSDPEESTLNSQDTYGVTLKKASALASEIPDGAKFTSLNIDQQYSQFKKLHLLPLKKKSGKTQALTHDILHEEKSDLNKETTASMASADCNDLLAKYKIPYKILSVKNCDVQEKLVPESEVVANRLSSSYNAPDFEKTAAAIKYFIDSPLHFDDPGAPPGNAPVLESVTALTGTQAPMKSKITVQKSASYDASPNVYSRPILPASRYAESTAKDVLAQKCAISYAEDAHEEVRIPSNIENPVENISEPATTESDAPSMLVSHHEGSSKSYKNIIIDNLSPKKARQSSPNAEDIVGRALTAKSKSPSRLSFERPSSATRVVWIDEAEMKKEFVESGIATFDADELETRLEQEPIKYKSPLSIYLNVADKNFRPAKSKYNTGLQLLPLRHGPDASDSKFDSKQRSVGLRFGERISGASVTGASAAGVQFNPVSALFRSKRWKSCSNYPLFTNKLKASKDLQRFARMIAIPQFNIQFKDEVSLIRCIESSKSFARHFSSISTKYDEFGELQSQPIFEHDSEKQDFFWTGLAE